MMKKIALIAVPATFLLGANVAQASDNSWFVGGAAQKQMSKSEQTPMAQNPMLGQDFSSKDRDWGFELKAGKYLGANDEHRVTMTYTNTDGGSTYGDYEQQNFLASYDYLYSLSADNRWRAFAGVTAGMAHTKFDGADSANDFVYGAQVGVNYRITDNWETELGYRYLKQDFSATASNGDKFELDRTEQVYLGVNYRF
ncbi:outer membrane protein [Echinimonas agarilytica]|uniref:Porin family protein n=1 Tax=Echinimonas agarilytica TaxID=1215918 RepID=A0AA42B700_9GAMM|nr:outer membrane beta-barrel protein [Echinimonas agarilytica]MCM2679342.1 porin family protein [Echinimonas agarilytica]